MGAGRYIGYFALWAMWSGVMLNVDSIKMCPCGLGYLLPVWLDLLLGISEATPKSDKVIGLYLEKAELEKLIESLEINISNLEYTINTDIFLLYPWLLFFGAMVLGGLLAVFFNMHKYLRKNIK